jgi:hypothetical protein
MAIILMLVLFGLFLGIEFLNRPAKVRTPVWTNVSPVNWIYAQDGGEPYKDPMTRDLEGLFGEGI